MPTGALPATIAVEFGFGSPPDATSPTWTDVSAYVDLGAGLTITPGRTAERSSIAPRRLSFTLDNRDGRFNPRNASGPYYGDLLPRVPIRVRATYSATTRTLFRGFVDGGWPQDFLNLARTVPVEAVDAVGWAATAPPPRSVFEAEVAALQDNESAMLLGWLRPQSDSTWREMVAGHSFPHAAVLEQADPLVDGDDEGGWADVEGAGYGQDYSDRIPAPLASAASPGLVTFWLRSTPGAPTGCTFSVRRGSDRFAVYAGAVGPLSVGLGVVITHGTAYRYDYTYTLNQTNDPWTLLDGATHMVAHWSDGTNVLWWIDGRPVDSLRGSWTATITETFYNWTLIGRQADQDGIVMDQGRVIGSLDHLQWWTDTDSWSVTPEEAVIRLHDAGRLARVGDSMDARAAWLIDASGWGLVGTFDASTVTTQQGYRRRGTVLELLQTIEDTEQGRVWVDNDGRFRFSHRSWPVTGTYSATVQATFGDTGSDLPYSAAMSRIVDDDRQIVNVAEVTREYGTQQRSENAASIAAYGRRSPASLSHLLYSTDRQARSVADWLVTTKGEPQARVEVLTFSPLNESATLCPLACTVEPGWLIRVKRDGLTFDAHVVDVGHRIGLTSWDVSLNLDATRATDLTGFTWDDGTGTVGTPWDDGTGTTTGAKGWVF